MLRSMGLGIFVEYGDAGIAYVGAEQGITQPGTTITR
jgi:hypothetical protein